MKKPWPLWYQIINLIVFFLCVVADIYSLFTGQWSQATFFLVVILELARQAKE